MSPAPEPMPRSFDSADDTPRLHASLWRSYGDFTRNRADWNRLVASIPGASVFFRHEWFDAAWQWAAGDSELYIVALHEGETLAGIAPLIIQRDRSAVPLRSISFLTVPDTQICDVLAAPAMRHAVLRALAEELHRQRRRWDILDLAYLPRASADELAEALRTVGFVQILAQGSNPAISLADGWTNYYSRRSRRLKKGNNLVANKLDKAGRRVTIEHIDAMRASSGDMEALLQRIVGVSQRSWKQETGMSLDFAGPNAFIRRLSEHAAGEGWLSLWLLNFDQNTVAIEYQLRYDGRVHALRSDFDAAAGELSPGTYLNWKMLQQLFDSGAKRYLMGPGENRYKLRWAEEYDQVMRVRVFGTTLRGRAKKLTATVLRPWARALRRRLHFTSEIERDSQ